jgi:glycine hydroxymethyltransferase
MNFSGQLYHAVHYGVRRETGEIDFDMLEEGLKQHRPKILVVGASAYPRILDFAHFARLAKEYEAYLMVDIAHIAGLIAVDLHPSPIPVADFVTSTTHKTMRGPRGGLILSKEKYAKTLDGQIFPGIQGGPLMHTIAGKAVAFHEALRPSFKVYQQQILLNARTLAEEFISLGYSLLTGGTDNHLLLMDLTKTDLTGQIVENALDAAGITVNKNSIPFDPRPPKVTSGIRIGTPAVTTRGMKEGDMKVIADFIHQVLFDPGDETRLQRIRKQVKEFCHNFPLYADEWNS